MKYFQLTQFMLDTLTGVSCGGETFVQIVPDKEKDKERYTSWLEHTLDTTELVVQGLMHEITNEHLEFVKGLEEQHGRKFRIYTPTVIGAAMFGDKKALNGLPN